MNIKAPSRNAIVKIELDNKEKYKFSNGIEIFIAKGYEFNRRLDSPSFAEIVDGEDLPTGAVCLIHHNSSHDSFKVFSVEDENGKEVENLYSISLDMIFCYKEEGKEWRPAKEFLVTKRIFREYKGLMVGIEPEQIPQRLFVISGKVGNNEIQGRVIITTKYSDYEVIFHENGKETSLIRTREREVLGVDLELTRQVLNSDLLVGNNLKDAKKLIY